MTSETHRAASEELRAIALELGDVQIRIQAIADTLKEPTRITQPYLDATTAAFHVFNALKVADALAGRLAGTPAAPAQPEPSEAAS